MERFPWTEDGLMLLRTIEHIIEQNGGIAKMHEAVFSELNERSIDRSRIADDKVLRRMIYHRLPITTAADLMRISPYEYTLKLQEYKKRNLYTAI